MRSDSITVKVTLLGKEYPVSCSPAEESVLLKAARQLDAKMHEIRNAGRTIGVERIAIMAALNFSHDVVRLEEDLQKLEAASQAQIDKLMEKVEMALDDI